MTSWLILVPTALELQHLPLHFLQLIERKGATIELCGFGPIVSAARAASLIAIHAPEKVVLCGVAGAIGAELQVASAYRFDAVACYGVGVGWGQNFKTAASLGWRHWPGDGEGDGQATGQPIADLIELNSLRIGSTPKVLLTTCSVSADDSDVALKREVFPNAVAEDMEGFAVAAACQLAGVPLTIVRGISNRAGDRDLRNWNIAEAMVAASVLVEEVIEL